MEERFARTVEELLWVGLLPKEVAVKSTGITRHRRWPRRTRWSYGRSPAGARGLNS